MRLNMTRERLIGREPAMWHECGPTSQRWGNENGRRLIQRYSKQIERPLFVLFPVPWSGLIILKNLPACLAVISGARKFLGEEHMMWETRNKVASHLLSRKQGPGNIFPKGKLILFAFICLSHNGHWLPPKAMKGWSLLIHYLRYSSIFTTQKRQETYM